MNPALEAYDDQCNRNNAERVARGYSNRKQERSALHRISKTPRYMNVHYGKKLQSDTRKMLRGRYKIYKFIDRGIRLTSKKLWFNRLSVAVKRALYSANQNVKSER